MGETVVDPEREPRPTIKAEIIFLGPHPSHNMSPAHRQAEAPERMPHGTAGKHKGRSAA